MAEKVKTWIPFSIGIVTSLFIVLGACGLFSLSQYPYRIDFIQKANLEKVYFLTLASFIGGIFCGVIALRLAHRNANRSVKSVFWICILLSFAGLMVVFCNPSFGVHSVITAKNICINNARKIEAAKVQWAQRSGATNGAVVSWNDIASYFTNGFPKCPEGGTYNLGKAGQPVECSIPGHQSLSQ